MHKVIKIGSHSHAVIIPADFIHALGIKTGDKVKMILDKTKGEITIYFSGILQLSLPTPLRKKK